LAESGKIELAAALVRSVGRLRMAAVGSSMLPAIRPRDLLLIRRCSMRSARVGDVVLFMRDARLFVHRVVSARGAQLITRGDALDTPDEPIGSAELLGRVERVVRRGRVMRPSACRPGSRWAARLLRLGERLGL
jgi:signal peptidase I